MEQSLAAFQRRTSILTAHASTRAPTIYRLASKLWLKTADIAALNGDYRKAIDLFEKVGAESVNNRLMRYSVKEYFLKAGICHLAAKDMVATERALEKYLELDPAFAREREYQLLVDLSAAVKAGDQQTFTDRLFDYDRLSRLDKWKTTMCVRIKDAIEGGVEGDEDDFA